MEKIQKTLLQTFQVVLVVGQWYYQSVQYVEGKNQGYKKYQETKGLLSNLGIRTQLNKNLILGDIFFKLYVYN